jgi:hypothetical protein
MYRIAFVRLVRWRRVSSASSLISSELRKKKLLVLGCGPSINQLPEDFFDRTDEFDIVAFSYAALLPTRITYYLYEIPEGELLKNHEDFLFPTLKQKTESGEISHVMLKNPHGAEGRFFELFPGAPASQTLALHLRSLGKLRRVVRFLRWSGLSKHFFFQSRASLFSTCLWADSVGYEQVVLAGIDLNTARYFYEEPSPWVDTEIPNPYPGETFTEQAVHPTNDERRGLKVEDAMSVLQAECDARIFILNPKSALSRLFPVYNFDDSKSP